MGHVRSVRVPIETRDEHSRARRCPQARRFRDRQIPSMTFFKLVGCWVERTQACRFCPGLAPELLVFPSTSFSGEVNPRRSVCRFFPSMSMFPEHDGFETRARRFRNPSMSVKPEHVGLKPEHVGLVSGVSEHDVFGQAIPSTSVLPGNFPKCWFRDK